MDKSEENRHSKDRDKNTSPGKEQIDPKESEMIMPSDYRRLEGSERRPVPGARDIGPADPNEQISVTIVLRRRPDASVDIESYAAIKPGRRRMSDDEFASKYGALQSDVQSVTDFAVSQGLSVIETSIAKRTVVVSGTVAQMKSAFGISLHRYELPPSQPSSRKLSSEAVQKTYRGRDGFIHVPADLANVIVGVFGLDNRRIIKRNGGDPPGTTPLPVQTVTKHYNFPTNTATGQTIAILSEDGYQISDVNQYFQGLPGFPEPTITDVSVDANNTHNADPETTQDICIAATAAPGANIAVYFTTYDQKGWVDLVNRVVHPSAGDPICSVLSSSFYVSDGDDAATLQIEGISISWLNAASAVFQDAAIQGVTVCIASGDTGTDSKVGDGKAHVQYPASDPWVLSCGGTTVGNVSGSNFDEYVWNDTFWGTKGATGGGVSDFFGLPAYQNNAGVPGSINDNHVGRGVPDVSANSSPNSGYPMIVGGQPFVGNGTSASAPLIAGLIAVINAALGEPVGFINPTLYDLGNSVIRNIHSPPGPADNSLNGVPGYPANAGWNASTGWGVIDGNALLSKLKQLYHKACSFIVERSTYGRDEIDSMLQQPAGAAINPAFWVVVDGFRPNDFPDSGITTLNPTQSQLNAWAPAVTPSDTVSGMTITPVAVSSDDPSLPLKVQRFTFTYEIVFSDDSAFNFPSGSAKVVQLNASIQSASASASIELINDPNPFVTHGQESSLSPDLRVFKVVKGESRFNAPGISNAGDAPGFIKKVLENLRTGNAGSDTFDSLPTDEKASALYFMPKDENGKDVYNFALARVRYRGLTKDAKDVRVFFRLFPLQSISTDYDADTTYREFWDKNINQRVPLLGVSKQKDKYITFPCFAFKRVDATISSMDSQLDFMNIATIKHNPQGAEVVMYYGCWLDINQPSRPICPSVPPANNIDGIFAGTLVTLQDQIRGKPQCLIAEIAYDRFDIPKGATPSTSDKLSQRNLAFADVP